MISASQRSYNEGTLSKARADGGIYGCPRNPELIRCNKLNPLDGSDYDILAKLVWNPDKEHEVKLTGEMLKKDVTVDQRFDLGLQTSGIRNLSYIRDQVQTRERLTLAHRYTPNLGWLDQVKWQVSHSPQERDFTGTRSRRLANGQNDRLEFLLNYREKFTEGDIQMNSSFKAFMATHKLTYGAYASVAETDYQRRDATTNLTTGVVTVAMLAGSISPTTPRHSASTASFRMRYLVFDDNAFLDAGQSGTPRYDLDPRPNPFYVVKPGNEPKQVHSEKLVKQFGVVYKTTDNISLVGRYAEGFQMPDLSELYMSPPSAGVNQDLVPMQVPPEEVKSYEAGIRGQFSRGYFSATVFKADYTDFIQNFVPIPSVNFPGLDDLTYQIFSVKLWGVELAGEFRFHENWTANVSIAYTEGKQKSDNATSPVVSFDGTTPLSAFSGSATTTVPTGLKRS